MGPLKVIIACGGTGGHLFPGIAVAEVLRGRGHEVLLLISEKAIDALAVEGYGDLEYATVGTVAMPRVSSPAMVPFLWRFWRTLLRCRGLVRERGADAVLGMGGFTSLPPVMAGWRLGAKTFVHESNAFPGKANRLTARFCDEVLLGFEACARYFPGRETEVVGTPVRGEFGALPGAAEARRSWGLEAELPTLLVTGGSQGARGVNRAVCEALPAWGRDELQVLHITGPADAAEVEAAYAAEGVEVRHRVLPFCQDMVRAYAAASLCVARSGASSLAELAACGLPALLVPYPHAADDHQAKNAAEFAARGAAVVIDEGSLGGGRLADEVSALLADAGRLEGLAAKCRAMAAGDAAGAIAGRIERACGR